MMFKRKYDPSNASLLEVAYVHTGSMLKAGRVVAFVNAWGIVRAELGHEPSVIEFAEYWGISRQTVYDQLHLFRQVFTCEFPGPILELVGEALASRFDLGAVSAATAAA